MQFQVPQFIEEDDKLFLSLSFKQFLYIGGGLGLSFIVYYFIGTLLLSLLPIIPILTLSGLLAFYKHNNRPFSFLLESFFYYVISEKLFIWKKEDRLKQNIIERQEKESAKVPESTIPMVTMGTLHDLSRKLDMKNEENNNMVNRL